jgi:hypothetical protein
MSNELNNQESVISVSIIDYIGQLEDGVSLLLSVMIFDEFYEIAYWFNRKGDVRLVPENKLLNKLNVKSIYDYHYIEDLIIIIHSNIPNTDRLLDELIK